MNKLAWLEAVARQFFHLIIIAVVIDLRVFLNSLNNPKFGASQNLKILIGIPPLDDPMTNLPKKNGWNSLQPPEMELQSLVPTESPS